MQIQNEITDKILSNEENEDELISCLFIPSFSSIHYEDVAINNTLNHVKSNNSSLL